MKLPETVHLRWDKAYRIISTRFPAIDLFEHVLDPSEWEAALALAALTNDRVRDAVGDLDLVPRSERVSGDGATYVMAPFTHPRPGRFSTQAWGAFYAAATLETAIAETVFHQEAACRQDRLEPLDLDVRVLSARIEGEFHDLRGRREDFPEAYHPDDYLPSQRLAARLREAGSEGIAYDSVRGPDPCLAVLRPSRIRRCAHLRYLCYRWDGERISAIYEKKALKR